MTTWWDKNLPGRLEEFKAWTGDANAPSRVAARKYIIGKGYRSVLDCGCGLGVDFAAYQRECPELLWYGLDLCETFCITSTPVGIGQIDATGCKDSAFDVLYTRHVLEHLPGYEAALTEMARVARREVMVIWFLKPIYGSEAFNYDNTENLYHNRYERGTIETFLKAQPRFESLTWEDVSEQECIMHVLLTDSAESLQR